MDNYDLISIENLSTFTFVVEKYQRGYKWGVLQVEDLLSDIMGFEKDKQAFYCLQPVVVKETSKNTFELIDGQQRLTTIFIVLQCLNDNIFELKYRTRDKSEAFLDGIKNLQSIEFDAKLNSEKKKNIINSAWENYIKTNQNNNNVDNYHFFTSYQVIENWLNHKDLEKKKKFITNLKKHTQIIWYQIISSKTPEELFINFNHGKIELEQAELIKALFVLLIKEQEPKADIRALKMNQFAEKWNEIENNLQDDRFWYFVSNDTSDKKKANRIDLLFDIINDKPVKEKNPLFSYYKYLNKYENKTLQLKDWREIKDLFYLLYEWYTDRSIYHLLGLLVYLNIQTITNVYFEYLKTDDKDKFKEQLINWVKDELNLNDPNSIYNLSDLSYKTYNETQTFLLIFNIAIYETSDFNYRFPFDKLKTQKWSLEHIHAQKPKDFKYIYEVLEWIEDIKYLIEDSNEKEGIQSVKNNLERVEQDIKDLNKEREIPMDIKNKVKEITLELDNILDKDSIRNLCLLDGNTNSKINNKNFRNKRNIILAIDRQGYIEEEDGKRTKVFIPLGTKNVFLKYYAKNIENIQFTYWGHVDRNDYESALGEIINNYLNIQLDGE